MGLREWTTATELGGVGSTIETDGIFVVTRVHIGFIEEEAQAWEVDSIKATDWELTLVDETGNEFNPASGVAEYLRRDDRFEAEVLVPERLEVGEEIIRNTAFDVPPNRTYTLEAHIDSPGGNSIADPTIEHMEVGRIESPT